MYCVSTHQGQLSLAIPVCEGMSNVVTMLTVRKETASVQYTVCMTSRIVTYRRCTMGHFLLFFINLFVLFDQLIHDYKFSFN